MIRTTRIKTILFLVFAIMAGKALATSPANAVPDAIEFAALKALYDNLAGATWTTKTNWPVAGNWPTSATSAQFGTWYGVTVADGDIVKIELPSNKLLGVLPESLGNLTRLTALDFANNQLSGGIPSSIVSLTDLQFLRLANNKLTGSIPATLGTLTKLTYLAMGQNQLTGPIPASLGNLTNLTTLAFSENQLSGNIPASIGNLVKLQNLSLYTNKLTGNIPSAIGQLVKLQSLHLATNQLTGNIPSSLGALTLATFMNLGKNQLTGSIPPELGAMSTLSELYLHENKLTGLIPASLGSLSKLRTLFLHTNQLSGPVPPAFSSLLKMEDFYIYNNRLEGILPPSLFNTWTNLTVVDLSNNQFTGSFPAVSNKNKLVRIVADRNAFSQLPADILTLPVLASLSVKNNALTAIPLFGNHVNKLNLTLALENNRLDYTALQTLKGVGIKAVTFVPQQPILDVTSVTPMSGSSLVITTRPADPNTTTTVWEKQSATGTWQSASTLNQDATQKTFTRNAFASNDEGIYRWRMTNSVVTETPVESGPITVKTAARFVLDNFAFQYQYDSRHRMTHKKVPGADWVYMVYDDRDRVVMTQDGEQRKLNGWSFTKFDAFNRPIMTGIYHHPTTLDQAAMSALISTTNFVETYTGAVTHHGYTNTVFATTTFPADSFDIYAVTYYDKYDFKAGWGAEFNYDSARVEPQTQAGYTYRQPGTPYDRVIGQVTGTKVKTTGNAPYWLYTVNYYDDRNRVIQQISDNYKGGTDQTTTLYDFVGKPLTSKTEHTVSKLTWQNLTLISVGVDNIAKTSASSSWNAGASSAEIIPANTDGWMETTVSVSAGSRIVGLSAQDVNAAHTSVQYAFYIRNRELLIWHSGVLQYTVPGGVIPGDRLRIERKGGYISYYRNGIKVYPAIATAVPCTTALLTDLSISSDRKASLAFTRMSVTQGNGQTVQRRLTCDHAGRVLQVWHKTNTAPEVLLVKNTYNELGQLITKKLHATDPGATFKQHQDYRYNIRGWLSRINQSDLTPEQSSDPEDLFGMNLLYNDVVPTLANAPQFNGNISAITWNNGTGQGDAKQNGYRYSYDPMNRITGADYRQKKTEWAQPTHLDDEGNAQASDAYSETAYQYDLNGNLKRLVRKGTGGLNMDELTYTYGATDSQQSNRLLGVADAGDKHQGFSDGNVVGDDYVYDNNGNMAADKNKNIAAITYNHLNLPIKVVKTTGEYVRYIYDATGRKHSQQVYDATNTLTKRSDYSGEIFYENDTLQFINHEEGRIVMTGTAPEYQYNLKDHLSNVRVTFTSKDEMETVTATLEDANAATEKSQFLNYKEAVTLNERLFDHTHRVPGNSGNATFRSTRLLGASDPTAMYGLAKSFSVMPGDKITAKVYAKYVDSSAPDVQQALLNFLTSLGTGGNNGPLIDGGSPGSLGGTIFPYADYLDRQNDTGDGPKAYLNYLVFDRDFNFLNGGYKRLTTNAREIGNLLPDGVGHDALAFEEGEIKITEPGFVYIYFSNENESRVEVFFDDFEVTHVKSRVVQMDDYYPFGLTFNSSKRENSLGNRVKFQGQERIEDLNLAWDSFKWRNYMPEIGRFFSVDPLAASYVYNSPYSFAENKLGLGVELEGLELGPMPYFFFARPTPVVRPVIETLAKTSVEVGSKTTETTPKAPSGKFSPETLENFARGNKTEAEQLTKNGLEKNNKPINEIDPKTGKEGTTTPDALKNGGKSTSEIKDVKQQGLTKQLRLQKQFSEGNGFKPELIINKAAKLTQPLKDANFDIKYYTPSLAPMDATKVAPPVNEDRIAPRLTDPT
jgi:RHS repeat-associated protein